MALLKPLCCVMCCCSTFIVFIMLRTGAAAEPHSGVCKCLQRLLMFYYFPLCYRILFSNIHEDNPPPLPQPPPKNTNTHATYTKQLWLLLHLRLCAHYWESGFSLHPRVVFPIDSEKNFNSPFSALKVGVRMNHGRSARLWWNAD